MELDVVTEKKKPLRLFKAWFKEWESEVIDKYDPVVKQKFLNKYGGLFYIDLDSPTKEVHTIDSDDMYWQKERGNNQWQVCGLLPLYERETAQDSDWIAWVIKPDTNGPQGKYDCIKEY